MNLVLIHWLNENFGVLIWFAFGFLAGRYL